MSDLERRLAGKGTGELLEMLRQAEEYEAEALAAARAELEARGFDAKLLDAETDAYAREAAATDLATAEEKAHLEALIARGDDAASCHACAERPPVGQATVMAHPRDAPPLRISLSLCADCLSRHGYRRYPTWLFATVLLVGIVVLSGAFAVVTHYMGVPAAYHAPIRAAALFLAVSLAVAPSIRRRPKVAQLASFHPAYRELLAEGCTFHPDDAPRG